MGTIEITNAKASAKIALNGAHIFHYQKHKEKPLLWLSKESEFEDGKAIRGGVPICWPWFGMPKDSSLMQHGFARTSKWQHTNTNKIDANTTEVVLTLLHSKESLKLFAYKFKLSLHVEIGECLKISLTTTNLDTKTFSITQALHSYFAVSNIEDVEIFGLEDKPYLDALTWQNKVQKNSIIFNQELDRVYQDVDKEIILKDKNRAIKIQNSNSRSVVVWNPWVDKCKRMSAMAEDAYKEFVCIESANAFDDKREIAPNESHTLSALIC
jgi:glucose-6-phosphate 1-epimerase